MTTYSTEWRRAGCWLATALLGAAIALSAGHAAAQVQASQPNSLVARGTAYPAAPRQTDPIKRLADVPIWRRITLGTHKGVNGLRAALDAANIHVGDSADEILGRPAFPFSKTPTPLDLVVLTPADLGLPQGSNAMADVYRRATQLGLELCPAETGPQLRLEYINQPLGEFLHIAMQPVATYHGDPVDLTVGNGGAGLLLLGGNGHPDLGLHSSVKFVFVRPQRVALPNVQ